MNVPVFVDSQVLIYFIEDNEKLGGAAAKIFESAFDNQWEIVISTFTVSESLIIPMRKNRTDVLNKFGDFINHFPALKIVYPTYSTSFLAAKIRAKHNFGLIDSYQLALAVESDCKTFLTNDSTLRSFPDLKIALLSQIPQH